MRKKTIVICCSAAFYKHANQVAEELEKLGFNAVVPATASRMKKENNYNVERIKTWIDNPEDIGGKQTLATNHFKEVEKGNAVLIINDDKPGRSKYIGPNTTMEWGLAYYLNKPVYLLNSVDKDHTAYEETVSMATAINGDLSKIKL